MVILEINSIFSSVLQIIQKNTECDIVSFIIILLLVQRQFGMFQNFHVLSHFCLLRVDRRGR